MTIDESNTPDHAVFFPNDKLVAVFSLEGDIMGAEMPAWDLEEALRVLAQNGYSEFNQVEFLDEEDAIAIHNY